MTDEEILKILDENASAFGFPSEMTEMTSGTFDQKVHEFMQANFKSNKPVNV